MPFRIIEGNLRESFRILATHSPAGETREYPGVTIASAGVAFQMFNAAFLAAPVASETELDRRVALAAVHFRARDLAWAYWVCEDWIEEKLRRRARAVFRSHDLRLAVELPGMIAERLAPPRHRLPELEVRRVADQATQEDFCAVGSVCFNVPAAWFREVFQNEGVWREFAAYVGYVDGTAIATAATVFGSGAVGVYNVATLPPWQRRGYGEMVMRHAVAEARGEHGVERTILQSTVQGFALYQRMGYHVVTRVAVYCS